MTTLQRRLKLVQCLHTSLTKIHSARATDVINFSVGDSDGRSLNSAAERSTKSYAPAFNAENLRKVEESVPKQY